MKEFLQTQMLHFYSNKMVVGVLLFLAVMYSALFAILNSDEGKGGKWCGYIAIGLFIVISVLVFYDVDLR